jgi:hypothetical protein
MKPTTKLQKEIEKFEYKSISEFLMKKKVINVLQAAEDYDKAEKGLRYIMLDPDYTIIEHFIYAINACIAELYMCDAFKTSKMFKASVNEVAKYYNSKLN